MPIYSKAKFEGLRSRDNESWVLSNLLAQFHCNEQKVIVKAKRHALLEWDGLQVDLQYTHEVPKHTFVRLTSSHIFLGMITWGVGSILLNMQAKLERDRDLAVVIQTT
jgi:hypothetical protein